MGEKLELDQATRMEIQRIANDMSAIRHTLDALVNGPEKLGGRGIRMSEGVLKLLARLVAAVEAKGKSAAE